MKRELYNLLTLKHKILIHNDALDFLSKSILINDIDYLIPLLKLYEKVDLEIARAAVKKIKNRLASTGDFIEIKNFKLKKLDDVSKYDFLRSKIKYEEVAKKQLLTGIYKKNGEREVFLIGNNEVELEFGNCLNNHFLISNIFVGLLGSWGESKFNVDEIRFPEFDVEKRESVKEWKIWVFNDFVWDENTVLKLSNVLEKYEHLGCIVFMGNYVYNEMIEKLIIKHNQIKYVFIPGVDEHDFVFLPKRLDPLSTHQHVFYASNPFEIDVLGHKIGFIKDEIFQHNINGIFSGENYLESFLKTYLSQFSFNPFSKHELMFEKMFNSFVVAQDSFSCVKNLDFVNFGSVEEFEGNGNFMEIHSGECIVRNLFEF